MLLLLSLILVATGLAFTFLFETLALQIIGAVLAMLGMAILIVYYEQALNKLKSSNTDLKGQMDNLLKNQESNSNSIITGLQEQLSQKNEEIKQLNQRLQQRSEALPKLSPELPIEKRTEKIRTYFESMLNLNDDYRRFFSELMRAAKNQTMRENIKNNFINPLMQKLNDTPLPMEDTNKQELLGDLMQLALVAIDFTQEFRSKYDGDDSLALCVAANIISPDKAAKDATKANTNVNETEKELRVLLALVTELGLNDRTLIVHDTLLQ